MVDKTRVLLVDDEPVFLDSMSKVLRARGYEIGAVSGGPQALEELGLHSYDLVILDMKMPGMDGIAVLKRIRSQLPAMPVILLSGHAEVAKAIEAMEYGAVDYVLKPARVDKLCEQISAALETKQILGEMTGNMKEGK